MADRKVRDQVGTIERITGIKERELTVKSGPRAGEKFLLYNIGVMLDGERWVNISANTEEKALEVMQSTELERMYQEGDKVKVYEESKNGRYWDVKAIVPADDADIEASKKQADNAEPADQEEPSKQKKEVKSESTVSKSEQKKQQVSDYQLEKKNQIYLGMAINNAAVIMASMLKKMDEVKADQVIDEVYPHLVEQLYKKTLEIRKENLGY